MKILDSLFEVLYKNKGFITIEEFYSDTLKLKKKAELSQDLLASIIAMDGRFLFDGDKIILKSLCNKNEKIFEKEKILARLHPEIEVEDFSRDVRFNSYHMDATYTVIDFETTGFSVKTCEVIEIGAVKIENGKIIDTFSTLIDAKIHIPAFITQLTGISKDMLVDAPSTKEAFSSLYLFAKNSICVAHNLAFDWKFLKKYYSHYNFPLPSITLCTMKLARRLLKDENLANVKLGELVKHFDIKVDTTHRALADAHATAIIFQNLLARAEGLGLEKVSDVHNLQSLSVGSL